MPRFVIYSEMLESTTIIVILLMISIPHRHYYTTFLVILIQGIAMLSPDMKQINADLDFIARRYLFAASARHHENIRDAPIFVIIVIEFRLSCL